MADVDKPFFEQETAIFNQRIEAFLEKFKDGGLDRLVEKWGSYYFERQSEILDEWEFKWVLYSQIQECVAFLEKKREKNDWDEVDRIHWIKEKYKELFNDDGDNSPKKEAIIEKIGAKRRFLALLRMSPKDS